MLRIPVDGIELAVRVEGEAEPVLLVHGFPDSSALFRSIGPRLVAAIGTAHHPESERWIADLSRPGRLTAALNVYRANAFSVPKHPNVRIPRLAGLSSANRRFHQKHKDPAWVMREVSQPERRHTDRTFGARLL